MSKIEACVGSRELNNLELEICRQVGKALAEAGSIICTGNAPGADQAYAAGANLVNPHQVYLFLPWYNFERHRIVEGNRVFTLDDLSIGDYAVCAQHAAAHHPKWHSLTQGAQKLHMRNVLIMSSPLHRLVDACIAWPSTRPGGGGTGQAMRLAKNWNVPLLDLSKLRSPTVESTLHYLKTHGAL